MQYLGERLDKKCGASAISANEKCSKSTNTVLEGGKRPAIKNKLAAAVKEYNAAARAAQIASTTGKAPKGWQLRQYNWGERYKLYDRSNEMAKSFRNWGAAGGIVAGGFNRGLLGAAVGGVAGAGIGYVTGKALGAASAAYGATAGPPIHTISRTPRTSKLKKLEYSS